MNKETIPVTIPEEQKGETQPKPWCGAPDRDGWCCGLSTGHAGDHDPQTSVWDVFRKSPEAVAKDEDDRLALQGESYLGEGEEMSHVGHKIVKCRQCGEVIMQCRCAEPQKIVEWVDHCAACLKRNRQLFMRLYADKDDPYTECAKAMCEMCAGKDSRYAQEAHHLADQGFWHQFSPPDGIGNFPCKASPIWEMLKK